TSLLRSLSTLDGPSLLGLEKAAQRESQRRASARSLIDFTCYTNLRYEPAGLHRQIAEQLERVEHGEIDRLMLLVPPRHGKSELASRRFPAWYLGPASRAALHFRISELCAGRRFWPRRAQPYEIGRICPNL